MPFKILQAILNGKNCSESAILILLVIKSAFQQQNTYSELSKNNSNDQEDFINSVFSFPDPVVADPEFQFNKLSLVLHCTICLHQYLMAKYEVHLFLTLQEDHSLLTDS